MVIVITVFNFFQHLWKNHLPLRPTSIDLLMKVHRHTQLTRWTDLITCHMVAIEINFLSTNDYRTHSIADRHRHWIVCIKDSQVILGWVLVWLGWVLVWQSLTSYSTVSVSGVKASTIVSLLFLSVVDIFEKKIFFWSRNCVNTYLKKIYCDIETVKCLYWVIPFVIKKL